MGIEKYKEKSIAFDLVVMMIPNNTADGCWSTKNLRLGLVGRP